VNKTKSDVPEFAGGPEMKERERARKERETIYR
jgi:hypothetical protein